MENVVVAELLPPADKQKIEKETSELVDCANHLVVDSPETYQQAAEFSIRCAAAIKAIHERLDPICEATDRAHKEATKLRGALLTVPTMARGVVDGKAVVWKTKQDALRAEAEREAREAEQRRADEERLRLAEQAEKIGDKQTRDVLLDKLGAPSPRPFSIPVGVRGAPKVHGFAVGESWHARLRPNGLKELVQAASKDDRLLCYLLPDLAVLNRVARAQRAAFSVPGVEAVKSGSTRVTV